MWRPGWARVAWSLYIIEKMCHNHSGPLLGWSPYIECQLPGVSCAVFTASNGKCLLLPTISRLFHCNAPLGACWAFGGVRYEGYININPCGQLFSTNRRIMSIFNSVCWVVQCGCLFGPYQTMNFRSGLQDAYLRPPHGCRWYFKQSIWHT